MRSNFKKFLGSFAMVSMLIAGINGLNVCSAMDSKLAESEATVSAEQDSEMDTLVTVFIEYTDALKLNLRYDSADRGLNGNLNLWEAFDKDCKHVETNRKGVCKHFSHYLIKKLRDKGVEAYPLYMLYSSSDRDHQAVLYKAGDQLFVADITSDIVALQEGDDSRKEKPCFFADKLDDFIKYQIEEEQAKAIYYIDADLSDSSSKVDDFTSKIEVLYM